MAPDNQNSSQPGSCVFGPGQMVFLSLTDIVTFLMGQPVITRLLWITLTSTSIDILNFNLAIFHIIQYLMSALHLIVMFWFPSVQTQVFKFLLVYAQIGGPLSLSFICIQRYVAVIHPTSYPLLSKYRYREVCAVIVWLTSVPIAFAAVFKEGEPFDPTEEILDFVSLFVLSFTTVMMMHFSISFGKLLQKSTLGREKMTRAFKVVCGSSTTTLCFYIPVTFMQKIKTKDRYTYDCIIVPACILLLSAASVVHPLFYISTQGKLCPCLNSKSKK